MEFFVTLETWEMMSYVVTVIGLPFAITVVYIENRRERQTDEEELYQRLSEEYVNFCKLLLENADLKLVSPEVAEEKFTGEQLERKKIIFDILVSLFERAFILVYEEEMTQQTKRLWASWDDYIHSWCRRKDFRENLGELLVGEDPDFGKYMRQLLAAYSSAKTTDLKSD